MKAKCILVKLYLVIERFEMKNAVFQRLARLFVQFRCWRSYYSRHRSGFETSVLWLENNLFCWCLFIEVTHVPFHFSWLKLRFFSAAYFVRLIFLSVLPTLHWVKDYEFFCNFNFVVGRMFKKESNCTYANKSWQHWWITCMHNRQLFVVW